MAMSEIYSWQRFWVPRGDIYPVDSYGFLIDPEQHSTYPLYKLEELQDVNCLVLLGESGQGKSTTLKQHVQGLSTKTDRLLVIDLNGEYDFNEVRTSIFDSKEYKEWLESDENLYLFLDSLDECAMRLETLGTLLAKEFSKQFNPDLQSKYQHLKRIKIVTT